MPGMNSSQLAASLDQASEITSKDHMQEDHNHQNLDEDCDLAIFFAYTGRFGKLKPQLKDALREQLVRLGVERVQVVLERCATRGRSWGYVLAALANEAPVATAQEAAADARWDAYTGQNEAEGLVVQPAPEAPLQPVLERIMLPWRNGQNGENRTVQDAWNAVFDQMNAQLGDDFRNRARGLTLVDFEANTFVVAAKTPFLRDELEGRLARTVGRILGDVGGRDIALQVMLEDEWVARYSDAGTALSA